VAVADRRGRLAAPVPAVGVGVGPGHGDGQFSEAEGFSHLHLHLVPRLPNHPEDARGPRVFAYMTDDQAQWLPATERDTIALSVRAALA
jgi:hypothetical protein